MDKQITDEWITLSDELKSLYYLIVHFNGIATYPNKDAGNEILYMGCLKLEKIGYVKRQTVDKGCVFFHPVNEENERNASTI